MSRFRSVQTRAYDKLPQVLAIKKALEAKTDFPATGELSGGVVRHADNAASVATEAKATEDASCLQEIMGEGDGPCQSVQIRPAQPLLNLGHVFREVERRLLG